MDNAANNIDAKSKSLKEILFERHYKVGYFQREYKWQRNHVEDLLIDLERSFNANWDKSHLQKDVATYDKYYMGPIVLYQDEAEFSIVDGQQRLTSFTLLMIFLNRQFKNILNIEHKFQGYIYSDYFGTSSFNMNIPERMEVFNVLFNGKALDESAVVNESCRNILERFNDINELFPQGLLEKDVLPLFGNWITEKLVFIEILTQTSESAYTIFETMNDRGLNLTQTELLKSFLLSNVKDESLIKELDNLWKAKMTLLNSLDNDQDFFKAWFRAKYAITIRTSEKGSANEDFEKIGTRFSSWTQENTKVRQLGSSKLLLDIKDSMTFYFFVKSDFSFFSDLYLKLKQYELSEDPPEHRLRLLNYKGVSSSLSYPLILASIKKIDDEQTINGKIDTVVRYMDSFGTYRMLLNEPITHSSIRNSMYLKIKDIRNLELDNLRQKLGGEILDYRDLFLRESYIRYDSYNAKYVLSRILVNKFPELNFENVYFQRRKDSFILYQFLKTTDFETEKYNLPRGLKDLLIFSLVSYTLIPRQLVDEFDKLDFRDRLTLLQTQNRLVTANDLTLDFDNLKDYFIKREKRLKEEIITIWKV
jgi:uncharacterized protein with ParB-like and HNH nuclease domain